MKTTNRCILTLALCLLLSACEQPGHTPRHEAERAGRGAQYPGTQAVAATLTTDAQSYAPGDRITVRLTNRSRSAVGYNLCRAGLDRNTDDDWRSVQATLGDACTAELRTLRPGQSAAFSFRTDRLMRRGQYRIRSELSTMQGSDRVTAVSNSFMLRGNDSD